MMGQSMPRKLAIIGAGVSGLCAARALKDRGLDIAVYEKSRGVSGRAASRTRHGVRFDHGANYIKISSETFRRLLFEELPSGDLVEIEGDIWTFDGIGEISPGDPDLNSESKWTYRSGISTLGKNLAALADTPVENQVKVEGLELDSSGWTLFDESHNRVGCFDAVLMTPPAPQAATILENSKLPDALRPVITNLSSTSFHRQFSVILGIDGELDRPGDFFALVNSDRKHDIAWLCFENDKPGHVPEGTTVLVVQMSPSWSAEHFDVPPQDWLDEVIGKVSTLLHCELPVTWTDTQRWKFAHPGSKLEWREIEAAESHGLFFAGDSLVGKGRVGKVAETGLEAADRILRYLEIDR